MTEDQKNSGGVPGISGGDENQNTIKVEDTVSYETHSKLLDEKKRRDEKIRALAAENEALKSAEKQRQEIMLKEKEDYKTLLKMREEELQKVTGEMSEIKSQFEQSAKLKLFLDNINGVVEKQYWSLVDLDKIKIDPNTGRPDPMSVQAAAKEFEQEYARVILPVGGNKTLPNGAAQTGRVQKMSYQEWKDLKDSKKMKENYHLVDFDMK